MGYKLPLEFIECAKEHGGGVPNPSRFDAGKKEGLKVKVLLSLDPRSPLFIWRYYTKYNFLLKDLVPIALDANEYPICLDYQKYFPPGVVYFSWDFSGSRASYTIDSIAWPFNEFLEMLY